MRHYTQREKQRGELAARDLSKKAFDAYTNADPMAIFERETGDGRRYDLIGMIDGFDLTFDDLQALLEDYADALKEY